MIVRHKCRKWCLHITMFSPPSPCHIPNIYDESRARRLFDEIAVNYQNSVASIILLFKGEEITRHTSQGETIMGNLLGATSNFLNKHDLAENGTVMDVWSVEYRAADQDSKFKDQWILTVSDTRTGVELGYIGLSAGSIYRDKTIKTIADSIESDGPYVGIVIKELPARIKGHSNAFVINDYRGNLEELTSPVVDSVSRISSPVDGKLF